MRRTRSSQRRSRRRSRKRRTCPGRVARGCAAELKELAEQGGWRSCRTWKRKQSRQMEERGDGAGSGRAKYSERVWAEGPGPEAEAGAGSGAAWKIEKLT